MTMRVLLVDGHPLVREGIAAMLRSATDVRVAGEAKSGREAIEVARRELSDTVLMDVRMPDMDGLETTKRIKEERPCAAMIIFTMHDTQPTRGGASGCRRVPAEGCLEASSSAP